MLIRSIAQRLARNDEVCSDNSLVTMPTSLPEYDRRRVAPPVSKAVSRPDLSALPRTESAPAPVIQFNASEGRLWLTPQRRQNLSRSLCAAPQALHFLKSVVCAVSCSNIFYPL